MSKTRLERGIRLDNKVPPCYGNVKNKDERYSTVDLHLRNTDYLIDIAEDERVAMGHDPPFSWDENLDEFICDGDYDFRVEINNRPGNRIEVCLRYITSSGYGGGNSSVNQIELTDRQRILVLRELNRQCKQLFNKTCKDLLAESENRWRARA